MRGKDPYHLRVKHVVKKDVITISADDSLQTAVELMADNRLTALPVLDGHDRCVGILSASDVVEITRDLNNELRDLGRVDEVSYQWLLENLEEHDMARHTVGEFMTRNVASVTRESTLLDAAGAMLRHRIHRLPVLNKTGRLQGIISTVDILTAFVEGAPATSAP
jgi:CBS domain-containing protein